MASPGGPLRRPDAALTLRSFLKRVVHPIVSRLGAEGGFGLAELVIAMVVLTVAITVLVASFSSATVAINRAARISTAGVIADSQMERFRAMTYAWIGIDTAVATDATYVADVACVGGATCSNTTPTTGASACRAGGNVFASFPANCVPTQTTTGPDGRSYRLDTYIRTVQSVAAGNPRSTKLVTVVVRDPSTGNRVLAREESDFDYCTSLPDPSGTGASCS
jgi:Tfp pilus assembly protein PilV